MQTIIAFFASINVTLFLACFAIWAVLCVISFQNFGRMFTFFATKGLLWNAAGIVLSSLPWLALVAFDWKTGVTLWTVCLVLETAIAVALSKKLYGQLDYVDLLKAPL